MAELGVFLSSEEHGPRALLEQAQLPERAGFGSAFISDHFHPWIDAQGQSPFAWGMIGAIAATTRHRVTTGVTCPTVRIHPVILAQAAATAQLQLEGRFVFGVGSGEALNEHILGDRWPSIDTRLAMLEEAVAIIRTMWEGKVVRHRGEFYTVDNARLYSRPEAPPPIAVPAFEEKATEVAARTGDGFVTTGADGGLLQSYRGHGGTGDSIAILKLCWGEDEQQSVELAHELWPTECLPGQQSQELPMPAHFEAAASIVTAEMVADKVPCGPDPERHVGTIRPYLDAGFDQVYVNQIGTDWAGFLGSYHRELRPRLGT